MITKNKTRVLVTGGGTFLGDYIAAMLLAEGAEVSLLVRPDIEAKIGTLAQRVRVLYADVWDAASLRGRGRGHNHVIHTVGSVVDDPSKGLTHHRLNFISARNVANMCVSDGVPHMVLISTARAPWLNRRYIQAKHEAEIYLQRVGLQATIIRAPLTYVRGAPRHPFYQLVSFLGHIPVLNWFGLRRVAPLPVDVLARGVARITLDSMAASRKRYYYAADLRRQNTRQELRHKAPAIVQTGTDVPADVHPFFFLGEETPFGWSPGIEDRHSDERHW